jgi:ABC-2 type transport system permease protein
MKGLLRSDFYRFLHTKILLIMLLVTALYSLIQFGLIILIKMGYDAQMGVPAPSDMFGYVPLGSFAASALPQMSQVFALLMVMFGAWFITAEFTQGTMRNPLTAGKSRVHVYISKLLVMLASFALCTLVSLCIFCVSFTLRFSFAPFEGFILRALKVLSFNFLLSLHFIGLSCMIAFLFRAPQAVMLTGFLVFFAENLAAGILSQFEKYAVLVRYIPQFYMQNLNRELINTTLFYKGFGISMGIFALSTAIGCLVFWRADVK